MHAVTRSERCATIPTNPTKVRLRVAATPVHGQYVHDAVRHRRTYVVAPTSPSAVKIGDEIHVFFVGLNRHLWRRVWVGWQWKDEKDLGGSLTSSPSAIAVRD